MKLGQMMQQAKKMQEKMQQMQEELAATEVTGESGGGMVRVKMGGDRVLRSVVIEPSLWDEQDKELIEDLVAAAVNAALRSVDEKAREMQQGMLAGMPLPPGFSL